MASRGQTVTVSYVAWDTSANAGKTGDVANHTLRWVKDGTSSAPTNSPAEVDATNAPGIYKLVMTGTEATCDVGVLCGKSATANVAIIPITITFEQLPTAAPGASTGLPLSVDASGRVDVLKINGTSQTARDIGASVLLSSGTGTGQISLSSGLVTLAGVTHTGAVIPTVTTTTTTTNLTNLPAITAGWLTAAGIAASALNGKGDWNIGKTGYSLTQTFPANFATLGINASGHVSRVTLADTITTYTGDTPQTGDSYARLGAAGAGLTALGDTRIANLDAAVSTRLATSGYTAPPSSATIAGAVWDVTLSGHLTAGSTGYALNAAGAAGDPWTTTLPGAYGIGSAGYIVGNRLDAAVASRMATFSYTAPDNASITAIKAKTDNLPTDPADESLLEAAITAATSPLATSSALATLSTSLDSAKGATFDTATDSLEAIRNRGDAAWVTGGAGSAPTVNEIADGVLDALLVDHNGAGTVGAGIANAQAAGNPWEADLSSYQEPSAGYENHLIYTKLNIGAPDQPVTVIPGPPPQAGWGRIFVNTTSVIGIRSAGIAIDVVLLQSPATVGGASIESAVATMTTDAYGLAYADVPLNASITPSGSSYLLTSAGLGWNRRPMTLDIDMLDLDGNFDLSTLV